MRAVRLALVLVVAGAAIASEPVPRPLDPAARGPESPADAPARRLPPRTTVCRDPAARRCWTVPAGGDCTPGTPFRTVIAGDDRPDTRDAVAACEAAVRQP